MGLICCGGTSLDTCARAGTEQIMRAGRPSRFTVSITLRIAAAFRPASLQEENMHPAGRIARDESVRCDGAAED